MTTDARSAPTSAASARRALPTAPDGFRAAERPKLVLDPRALRDALAVAGRACDAARAEILPRYRKTTVETKQDGSPVTVADREAERAIRRVIGEAFPDDAILGEEFGSTGSRSRRRWVVDPIDGTVAFTRGIPLFTTIVALLYDDEPVVGMIDLPAVGDRIGGFAGGGVFRGDERLAVSTTARFADALVCHGDLFCFDRAGLRGLHERMAQQIPKLRGYTDAFGHLLVLSGA
ncbi:hypothetical protein K2X89_13050, partial [Myxococcota bacterium]|nr:hypothetical protein [Myxococcota bacterium]